MARALDGFAATPVIVGGGLEAVVVAVAELFVVLGSSVEESTVAVLLITVPSTTEQFTLTNKSYGLNIHLTRGMQM